MDGLIDFLIFVGFIGFCIFFDKLNDIMKKTQKQSSPKPVVVATPPQQKPYQPPHQKNSVKKANLSTQVIGTNAWNSKTKELEVQKTSCSL